jgi:hypothetical protein
MERSASKRPEKTENAGGPGAGLKLENKEKFIPGKGESFINRFATIW